MEWQTDPSINWYFLLKSTVTFCACLGSTKGAADARRGATAMAVSCENVKYISSSQWMNKLWVKIPCGQDEL